jgi:hypothetical protein
MLATSFVGAVMRQSGNDQVNSDAHIAATPSTTVDVHPPDTPGGLVDTALNTASASPTFSAVGRAASSSDASSVRLAPLYDLTTRRARVRKALPDLFDLAPAPDGYLPTLRNPCWKGRYRASDGRGELETNESLLCLPGFYIIGHVKVSFMQRCILSAFTSVFLHTYHVFGETVRTPVTSRAPPCHRLTLHTLPHIVCAHRHTRITQAGTSDLWQFISKHPAVNPGRVLKEQHYFTRPWITAAQFVSRYRRFADAGACV